MFALLVLVPYLLLNCMYGRERIVRKYEPMTSREAWLCFLSLQHCSLQNVDWHWCVGLSAQDIVALKPLFTLKKIKKWNRITHLSCVRCGLEMRSSVVSHCSQRRIHKSRIFQCGKKTTVFWSTLKLYVSISKNKHITESMMGETDKPERLKWC